MTPRQLLVFTCCTVAIGAAAYVVYRDLKVWRKWDAMPYPQGQYDEPGIIERSVR